jgi:trans-aconitate methyltransferase
MDEAQDRWDTTYATKADNVSWFQPRPERSLSMIADAARGRPVSVIDIGGGASRLVDGLLAAGHSDIAVLDISGVALERSKVRLAAAAAKVEWIVADITRWRPARTWNIWHDRAVFHFLTDPASQAAYLAALHAGTEAGSCIIMATFAPDGPEKCSGLPVQRYSPRSLADRLGAGFALYAQAGESHPTPFGTTQAFTYAAFRRI